MKQFTIIAIIGFTIGVLTTCIASAGTVYNIRDGERVLEIPLEIKANIIETGNALDNLSTKSKKPVLLLVNSFGGSVMTGNLFIGAMKRAKARGVRIDCIVTAFSISMGINILGYCDRRYALPNTYFLFHEAGFSYWGKITISTARDFQKQLEMTSKELDENLRRVMGISEEDFRYHNERETLWTARAMCEFAPKFVKIIDDVKGLPDTIGVLDSLITRQQHLLNKFLIDRGDL